VIFRRLLSEARKYRLKALHSESWQFQAEELCEETESRCTRDPEKGLSIRNDSSENVPKRLSRFLAQVRFLSIRAESARIDFLPY
jgi:hypothetical protein